MKGYRNETLNTAGFNIGLLVATRALDAAAAKRALRDAGLAVGLPEFEVAKTLARAFQDAAKKDVRHGPAGDRADWRPSDQAPHRPAANSCAEPDGPDPDAAPVPPPPAAYGGGYEPPGPNEPTAKPLEWYSLLADSVVLQLQPVGARLATGFETLDKALRGGLPMRRRVVVQGPPGSGKTSLLCQLMHHWSQAGIPCVWLAADEAAGGIITRLGQLAGFARDELEAEDAGGTAARARFAAECGGQEVVVIDPDADLCTIEDAERVLLDLEPDGARVLFVDSLQTARCAAAKGIDSVRECIDCKLEVLKGIALRGTLILAASEVSRGAYRSQDRAQRIDPLAAGKESGGIEYGVDVLLSLSNVRGGAGLVDAALPKNRLGEKLAFRLRQDYARSSFTETELPPEQGDDEHAADLHRAAVQRVREAVLSNPRLESQRDVLTVCKGRRADNARAVRFMELELELVRVDGFYRLRGPVDPEASDDE